MARAAICNSASNLTWHSGAALTLAAYRNVVLSPNATIRNSESGNLTLRADASAIDNGASVTNGGTIDWSKSMGTVDVLSDMNGAFTPGTMLSNPAWTPVAYTGRTTQITGYELVNTLADLENIANNLAGNYALGTDIDASSTQLTSYVPLGDYTTPFSGQFDGFGHRISGLWLFQTVNADDTVPVLYSLQAQGLFGVIGTNGVVRNLNLNAKSSYAAGSGVGYDSFDLLAGVSYGKIFYVNTSGSIGNSSGYEGYFAGLVGYNDGTVTRSYATGSTMFGPDDCGFDARICSGGASALIMINNGTISQSFGTGPVTDDLHIASLAPAPAGIAAINTGAISNDVFWNAQTTGTSSGVGQGIGVPASNGLSSAQINMPSSFTGYDFSANSVWVMQTGGAYPGCGGRHSLEMRKVFGVALCLQVFER